MTGLVLDRIAAATLRPDESRQVFRAVLDALSRPGHVVALPTESTPAVLLPVLALADLGTGVAVLDDGEDWTEVVGVVTSAPAAPLEQARFVAATRPVTADELRAVCRGSALAPEDGALVCLPVSEVDGDNWAVTGPGVAGTASVSGVDGLLAARAEAVAGFPAGIDLLLIAPDGRMTGIPRSTTVEGRDR
ncbi:phosphonate C-P lyase system protein PhnH [Amycolatopsis nigrescens]|uniref:phosphonate C-P lyase system protein PhnH n=1 Tax=Amycolatopsis nigrescens TaxID=381445 RepID=UPI000361A70B|nr:phosphonate C-P lyase system protein PhnH [Amycolatopsis nigrescens]